MSLVCSLDAHPKHSSTEYSILKQNDGHLLPVHTISLQYFRLFRRSVCITVTKKSSCLFPFYWIFLVNCAAPSKISSNFGPPQISVGEKNSFSWCEPEESWTSLANPAGHLTWTDTPKTCVNVWYWVIQKNVSASMGIVLDFHDVQLASEDQVEVFDTILINTTRPVRSVTNTSPVLIYSSQAVIRASTPAVHKGSLYSSFNVTLSTHPLSSLPTQIRLSPWEIKLTPWADSVGSKYIYNCSSPSVQIPDALKCDKITQCVGGEDELNCDYKTTGCGDWVPYEDRCLKFVFRLHDEDWITHRDVYKFYHNKAERTCMGMYQSTLLNIPYGRDRNFIRGILLRSGFKTIHLGLKKFQGSSQNNQRLYRFLWQWGGPGGPVAYDQISIQRRGVLPDCSMFTGYPEMKETPIICMVNFVSPSGYVCSRLNRHLQLRVKATKTVSLFPATTTLDSFPSKRCSDSSLTHLFYSCPEHLAETLPGRIRRFRVQGDAERLAKIGPAGTGMSASRDIQPTNSLPQFQCRYGHSVHYSVVCDGFNDCVDGTDEVICERPRLDMLLGASFVCQRIQVIPGKKRCNGFLDCMDGSDEEGCASCQGSLILCALVGCVPDQYRPFIDTCAKLKLNMGKKRIDFPYNSLGKVTLDGYGMSRLDPLEEPGVCPETHFLCPDGMCIPSFLLNNGEQDCRHGEDEDILKENFTCPGFYRCYITWNCIHPIYVCDGIPHCPNRDDELFCNITCPQVCTCQGHAYTCRDTFTISQHLYVRYLDLSAVLSPSIDDLRYAEYLHFLNLSFCQLINVTLKGFVHLQVLDLSYNLLFSLASTALKGLKNLIYLDLSHNPIARRLDSAFNVFLNTAGCLRLQTLVMINNSLRHLEEGVFTAAPDLVFLDVRGNDIESFDVDVFRGLGELRVLKTDSSRLCCSLPASSSSRCQAPVDELSSCSDLLRSDFFRVFTWALSLLALTGNAGVLVYRLFLEKVGSVHGYRVLVIHLCVSDFLMGVYLSMIGIADSQYRGHYVMQDTTWRHSATCKLAGFLAVLSSEVSAFMLCLITADRVLTLCFPFHTKLHTTKVSAAVSCCLVWGTGFALAVTPLLPPASHWNFYSQTGICIPLPVTRVQFPGQGYAFSIFIVLNFVNFVFIGGGQMLIFRAIRQTSAAARTQRTQHDLTIARRLFVVAFSDFCCWFPVGLMGLLAAGGVPIPGVVNVWVAVFVLPLNSALNPFLYTLNATAEKWRAVREQKRMQRVIKNLQVEIDRWPAERVEDFVRYCLRTKLAGRDITLSNQGKPASHEQTADDE